MRVGVSLPVPGVFPRYLTIKADVRWPEKGVATLCQDVLAGTLSVLPRFAVQAAKCVERYGIALSSNFRTQPDINAKNE